MNRDLTPEELIELINSGKLDEPEKVSERKSRYEKQICRFIQEKSILSGTNRIPTFKVIYEYYKWDPTATDKASVVEFGRVFSKFFEQKRTGRNRFYMLNEFTDLSDDSLNKSYRFYKKNFLRKKKNDKEESEELDITERES